MVKNYSKLTKEKPKNYFTDIVYKMIMKVNTIGNLQQLTNTVLFWTKEKRGLLATLPWKILFRLP